MRGVIENGRIRAAGESWKYGLALARNEAVRRNAAGRVRHRRRRLGGAASSRRRRCCTRRRAAKAPPTWTMTITPGRTRTASPSTRFGRIVDPNPDGSPPIAAGGHRVRQSADGVDRLSPAAPAGARRRHDAAVRSRASRRPTRGPACERRSPRARAAAMRGSALIEVLVSVLLFSVGIVGAGAAARHRGQGHRRDRVPCPGRRRSPTSTIGRMWVDRANLAELRGRRRPGAGAAGRHADGRGRRQRGHRHHRLAAAGRGRARNHVVVATLAGN